MPSFVIALIIVVGGLWLIRKSAKMDSKSLSNSVQKLAGVAVMAGAGLLFMRGQSTIAATLFAVGAGLFGKSSLFPDGFPIGKTTQTGGPSAQRFDPRKRVPTLSKLESYEVLGLKPGASEDDVKAAYKRLMKDFHPDMGGSDYLAAKINEAKDVLLG
jgi:DnaJ domain